MNLYLVRHGETDYNLHAVFYGWIDCPINETGMEQAKKLQHIFSELPLDYIITSTLYRTKQTAEIIKKDRQVKMEALAELREIHFGDWEGKTFQEIMERDPENCKKWWEDWSNSALPGGESFQAFYTRVCRGFDKIYEKHSEDNVLVVCHSGVIASAFCYYLGMDTKGFWKFRPMQGTFSQLSVFPETAVIERINAVSLL